MAAIYDNAGAPVAGTSAVQTIATTGTPTGGTFKLSFRGKRTADIAFDATAATVIAALIALPNIAAAEVVGGGGPLPTGVTVTFALTLAKSVQPLIVLAQNSLTGGTAPTVTITNTTPGVEATQRNARKGDLLSDVTNGILYINTGSTGDPTWTKVGTQS